MPLNLKFQIPLLLNRPAAAGGRLLDTAINDLQKKLRPYMSRKDRAKVMLAYRYAALAHQNQKRFSGEPYITHPLAVASNIADMKLGVDAISAALLHDVVEDTYIDIEQIRIKFGDKIADMVEGLTKLKHIQGNIKTKDIESHIKSSQSENFQKLVLATAHDMRVILIKFADRLHNLRTAEGLPLSKRKKMAKETMSIYAPLANRLGMENLRMELEDLSFAAAYPMRYGLVKNAVKQARSSRHDYITKTIGTIQKMLKDNGLKPKVIGRRKNIAGIYKKMVLRSSNWLVYDTPSLDDRKSLQEIMDVYGIRIIVNKVAECYSVLGIMHSLFSPINRRFKDYIANPKKNGYQSLHSTLMGPNGFPLEIQIRTHTMHEVAERGIAAHFLYKNGSPDSAKLFSWLQHLAQIQKEAKNTIDFMDKAVSEFSLDEIFVYTPNGDLISLPVGGTPVDFAYAVHTELGAKCVACEIDRVPAPLNIRLKNGQVIKIISDPQASPDLSWSSSAVTPKALSHIANYAHMEKNTDMYGLGEKLLNDALLSHYNSDIKSIQQKDWDAYLDKHKLSTKNELYKQLSLGKITPLVAASYLLPSHDDVNRQQGKGKNNFKSNLGKGASLGIHKRKSIIKYARCCRPIPGDRILAISTKQDGIHVHCADCHNVKENLKKKGKEKFMPAHWELDMEEGEFPVAIRCESRNPVDTMSKIVRSLGNNGIGVQEITTEHSTANVKVLIITILVHNREHLAKIIRKIKIIKDITRVSRANV